MVYSEFVEQSILLNIKQEKKEVINFLTQQGLKFEDDIEYTMVIREQGQIIATGSLNRNVLKCIAVDERVRGLGLTNQVVSHLIREAYSRGQTHLFVYTKPVNEIQFSSLGFYTIEIITDEVLLMENTQDGINTYLNELMKYKKDGEKIASIVVNCNPFTKGHRYLIEKAASESDWLHVFVVWEEKSVFPSEVRYQLVKEGTSDINNVSVHKGINYIISSATFPSYFLKEDQDVVSVHARLDLNIYGRKIAPALGINRRYIGEEPYCAVTKKYNEEMKRLLPFYGIEVHEIPRKEFLGEAISASKVRQFIKENRLESLKEVVPKSTYQFLESKDSEAIIMKIKQTESRH